MPITIPAEFQQADRIDIGELKAQLVVEKEKIHSLGRQRLAAEKAEMRFSNTPSHRGVASDAEDILAGEYDPLRPQQHRRQLQSLRAEHRALILAVEKQRRLVTGLESRLQKMLRDYYAEQVASNRSLVSDALESLVDCLEAEAALQRESRADGYSMPSSLPVSMNGHLSRSALDVVNRWLRELEGQR